MKTWISKISTLTLIGFFLLALPFNSRAQSPCVDLELCLFDQDCSLDITVIAVDTDLPCATDTVVTFTDLPNFVADNMGGGIAEDVPPGIYQITYVTTDTCGNTSTCEQEVEVIDCKSPVPFCQSGLIANLTNTVPPSVDVFAIDFDAGSFDNCSSDLSFSYSQDTQDILRTYDCEDVGELFIVDIWLTDEAGNQDYCTTFITIQDNLDYCSDTVGVIQLSGTVKRDNGDPVDLVSINCSECPNPSFLTDEDGSFSFINVASNTTATVTASKDINYKEGVNVLDMLVLRKHVLGILPITNPNALIAADVSNSGGLSTFDLVLLQQLVLGITDDFSAPSWKFSPPAISLNNPGMDVNNLNFLGIKMGDIIYNSDVDSVDLGLELRFGEVTTSQSVVEIPLTATNFEGIEAMQWGASWNPEVLEFIQITSTTLPQITSANYHLINDGQLTFSWFNTDISAGTLADGDTTMSLQFNVLADPGNSSYLQFDQSEIEPLVIAQGCKIAGASFFSGGVVIEEIINAEQDLPTEDMELFFLNPAPAGQALTVAIKGVQEGRLQLFNASGQLTDSREIQDAYSSVFAPASGVYWLIVQNEKGRTKPYKVVFYE
jgi:hypothetical protein